MKQTAAKGHTTKHAKAAKTKHSKTAKHHPAKAHKTAATTTKAKVHTKAKHPAHAKARALSPGYDVACCSALALAESARLAGHAVGADDVFALYWRTARDPDAGASILATLRAAREYGLAGVRPVSFRLFVEVPDQGEPFLRGSFQLGRPAGIRDDCDLHGGPVHDGSVILGLELPGPHAVLAETGRWWSWSQPWPPAAFPDAVVEEAWAVVWP